MAYVAVDEKEVEWICDIEPKRDEASSYIGQTSHGIWLVKGSLNSRIELPKGSIEKLIGRKLTWEDEPVELKEQS